MTKRNERLLQIRRFSDPPPPPSDADFPTIEDIPIEILCQIFALCSVTDRRQAALVSKKWLRATRSSPFFGKLAIKERIDTSVTPLSLFRDSWFPFAKLSLTEVEQFHETDPFWSLLGANVRELEFCRCKTLTNQILNKLLVNFPSLQILRINGAQQLSANAADLTFTYDSFTELDLIGAILERPVIENLITHFPNLKYLRVNVRSFFVHKNYSLKRDAVLESLKAVATTAKVVKYSHGAGMVNVEENLQSLESIPNLHVEKFMCNMSKMPIEIFRKFCATQSQIQHLVLFRATVPFEPYLQVVNEELTTIRELHLDFTDFVIDRVLEKLSALTRLERLYLMTKNDQAVDLTTKVLSFPNLREIRHYMDYTDPKAFECLLKSSWNLTVIEISLCVIDDVIVKVIVENCRKLQVVKLGNCSEITDIAILGTYSMRGLKGLESLHTLELGKCSKLHSISLPTSFKLPEVQILKMKDLTRIQKITLDRIAMNCRVLREAFFSFSANASKTTHVYLKLKETTSEQRRFAFGVANFLHLGNSKTVQTSKEKYFSVE